MLLYPIHCLMIAPAYMHVPESIRSCLQPVHAALQSHVHRAKYSLPEIVVTVTSVNTVMACCDLGFISLWAMAEELVVRVHYDILMFQVVSAYAFISRAALHLN